jgi:hypothetical protein
MYERILQKLKEQRKQNSNVSDRSLADLAKSLESIILTEEILSKIDLSKAIESIDGNIRGIAADEVKKTKSEVEAAKKAADDEEKRKKAETEKAKKMAGVKDESEIPEYVKAIMEQNKLILDSHAKISADLGTLRNEKISSTRAEKLNKILDGAPSYLANPIKSSFQMAKFETDDEFDTYLSGIETEKANFIQQAKVNGLNTTTPGIDVKKPDPENELPPIFKKAFESINVEQKQDKK